MPPPAFQSRILTRDTDRPEVDGPTRFNARPLLVVTGVVLAVAGLAWAGFAVWQFYDAVARLTTFAQSAAV